MIIMAVGALEERPHFKSLAELTDDEALLQTQEIVANCLSFGKDNCDYVKTGILTYCLFCDETYKNKLIK